MRRRALLVATGTSAIGLAGCVGVLTGEDGGDAGSGDGNDGGGEDRGGDTTTPDNSGSASSEGETANINSVQTEVVSVDRSVQARITVDGEITDGQLLVAIPREGRFLKTISAEELSDGQETITSILDFYGPRDYYGQTLDREVVVYFAPPTRLEAEDADVEVEVTNLTFTVAEAESDDSIKRVATGSLTIDGPDLKMRDAGADVGIQLRERQITKVSVTVENVGGLPVDISQVAVNAGADTATSYINRTVDPGQSLSLTTSPTGGPGLPSSDVSVEISVNGPSGLELASATRDVAGPDVTVTSVEPQYETYEYSDGGTLNGLTVGLRNDGGLVQITNITVVVNGSTSPTLADTVLRAGERTTLDVSAFSSLDEGQNSIEVQVKSNDRILATSSASVTV